MKTIASIFAVSCIGAGAALAQKAATVPDDMTVYDYDTMAGYNDGLTEEQFGTYDTDRDGVLSAREKDAFEQDGYSTIELGESTDGFENEIGTDD